MMQSLAGAGVKFSGDQSMAAMGMMRSKQLTLEEEKARLQEQLEAERYARVLAEKELRDMKEAHDKLLEELEWRRKFNSCEWHRRVEAPVNVRLVPSDPAKKKKLRQIVPSSCIPAAFQLLLATPDVGPAKKCPPRHRHAL